MLSSKRLRAPAYARALVVARARGEPLNVSVHVGRDAWDRRGAGIHSLVIALDHDRQPEDYDCSCLAGLDVLLHAETADIILARRVAVRCCENGARMVVLLHPKLDRYTEFFYRAGP
jgi:hypothetical protein